MDERAGYAIRNRRGRGRSGARARAGGRARDRSNADRCHVMRTHLCNILAIRRPRDTTTAQDRPLRNAFSQFPQSPEWNMPFRTVGKTQIDQELPVIFASQQITMTH